MPVHPYPELKQKLSRLKVEQRKAHYRAVVRSLVVSGFVGGILVLTMSPRWLVTGLDRFELVGDRIINQAAVYNVLEIATQDKISKPNTPSSNSLQIWAVNSNQITRQLEAIPAIESVRVSKTLFPPTVKIYIKERIPVATATSNGQVGFLDYQGVWLDPGWYRSQNQDYPLTKIKAINFQPAYQETWQEIYSLINAYPNIEVKEIEWQHNGEAVVVTKQVRAILGNKTSLLRQQFAALASFTDITREKDLTDFSQIDLRNPDSLFLNR